METLGENALAASQIMAATTTEGKNQGLMAMAAALRNEKTEIMTANARDMENALKNNMTTAFQDRLALTEKRIEEMAEGLEALATLADPVGEVVKSWIAAQDIEITEIRVPLGVVGIIYEARPNVTSDGAGICLKTGNAVILRGGSDAINSNMAVGTALRNGLTSVGLPADMVQVVTDTSREVANEMMALKKYIDVLIPRGGAGLINSVVKNATVPVIETGAGNCHLYIDETADVTKAVNIALNAKVQRPAVCNAIESLLVAQNSAETLLPAVAGALIEAGVEIHGCPKTMSILESAKLPVKPADEEDFYTEYGSLTIACKVVADVHAAVSHINKYNTKHSEAIVTEDQAAAKIFQQQVDAAAVYVNTSTRFTDGFQYGFGAEIGISTQKLHARGPMGLYAMTSTKYLINSNGKCRN